MPRAARCSRCNNRRVSPGCYGQCGNCFSEHLGRMITRMANLPPYDGEPNWVRCTQCHTFFPANYMLVRLDAQIVCARCMQVLVLAEERQRAAAQAARREERRNRLTNGDVDGEESDQE